MSPAPRLRRAALALPAAALLAGAPAAAQGSPNESAALPRSALAVRSGGRWVTFWRSEAAPASWRAAHPAVAGAVRWREASAGVSWGELQLAGTGEARRLRVVLVRVDPAAARLRLASATRAGGLRGVWTIDSAAADAAFAVNAGQFRNGVPWGWLVRDGREVQPPGTGPLAMALVIDSAGAARLVPAAAIDSVRSSGGVALAIQSYPALLDGDGAIVPALAAAGRGVDVAHRDARLAVCTLRDGRLLFALTRFEGLGGALEILPFGPTTPEMAALAGALGCRRAMLLDGGISGQLLLRERGRAVRALAGMRAVPLAVEVVSRGAR